MKYDSKKLTYPKYENNNILNITSPENFSLRNSGNILESINKDSIGKTYINSQVKNNCTENLSLSKNNSCVQTLNEFPKDNINYFNYKYKKGKKGMNNKDKKDELNAIDEKTRKIDFRNYKKYPVKSVISLLDFEPKEKYFWFAAYDKLIHKKKLLKIFSFYNFGCNRNYFTFGNDFINIKEKKLIINDYELYFTEKSNNPFIKKSKGKKIYIKLYLLTLKQINMIFSYLNRIEYKIYINNYDLTLGCKKLSNLENNIKSKEMKYNSVYCLGSYMNINIFCFSRTENVKVIGNFPKSKKIAKLIKILMVNFPENSKEYFINYIFSSYNKNLAEKTLIDKKNEINNLLLSNKKGLFKPSSKSNSVIYSSVSGIPEFSYSPFLNSSNYNNVISNFNLKNNVNNKNKNSSNILGTISYNASCFDFTSDFLNSMNKNEENLSKIICSLSNHNININRNTKNKMKNNNIKNNNNSKISNFSFDNNSNTNPKSNNSNNFTKNTNDNYIIEKILKSNEKFFNQKKMMKTHRQKRKKSKINYIKQTILNFKNNTEYNHKALEANKENYSLSSVSKFYNFNNKSENNSKYLSDFTLSKMSNYINKTNKIIKKFQRKSIINNNRKINKTFIKGEDIFMNVDRTSSSINKTTLYTSKSIENKKFKYKKYNKI